MHLITMKSIINWFKSRPTRFTRTSQIMNLQAQHIIKLLLRMRVAQVNPSDESTGKSISIQEHHFQACILKTLFNWTVILFTILTVIQLLPAYAQIYGSALRIANYDKFSSMATVTFLLLELFWFDSFQRHLVGKSSALRLVCHYSAVLDRQLTKWQRTQLCSWFNVRFGLGQVYFGSVYTGIGLQMAYVFYLTMKQAIDGRITPWEVPLYMIIAGACNYNGAFWVIFSVTFMIHLFFMAKVFKGKLSAALALLKLLIQR